MHLSSWSLHVREPTSSYAASAEMPEARVRLLPRVRLQSSRLDAGDRAGFVIVRGVAADADGAEQHAAALDQHAAGHRDQPALRQCVHRIDKIGLLLRTLE